MEQFKTQEFFLNCLFSPQNNNLNNNKKNDEKMRYYITAKLFHGNSRKSEKQVRDIDENGHATFYFTRVNLETAYVQLQVFSRRRRMILFSDHKHVGDANLLVSDIVSNWEPSVFTTFELGKKTSTSQTITTGEKAELKLLYTLPSNNNDHGTQTLSWYSNVKYTEEDLAEVCETLEQRKRARLENCKRCRQRMRPDFQEYYRRLFDHCDRFHR